MDGEEIYEVSPLTEGLLVVNGCWKSGKSFFFSDGATGKLPMPQFEKKQKQKTPQSCLCKQPYLNLVGYKKKKRWIWKWEGLVGRNYKGLERVIVGVHDQNTCMKFTNLKIHF